MGIEYEDETEGEATGGRWAVHAFLRCDGCAALLARGVARRPIFPTEREAGASRSEALSKAVYRAGLIPGVVLTRDDGTLDAAHCAACAARRTRPLEWRHSLGGGDYVVVTARRDRPAGVWTVDLSVRVAGIRYEREGHAASEALARELAETWIARAPACAAEVRALAARHPQAATRARSEGAGVSRGG